MAYNIHYSDYSTTTGPPDPARWVGPPGPTGPQGPPGPQGSQGVPGTPYPDAPADGTTYGRNGAAAAWAGVLPLSGGTVTGPTSFANISYNMLASGAVGDGVTDDAAKIQTFLNSLPIGAEIVLPATKQFLIDSADLTVPVGLTICAQGGLESGNNLLGPAIVLNPARRIVANSGVRLSNFKILRKGLLPSPTTAQSNAAVTAWAAEAPLYKTSASTASGNTLPFSNTTGVTVGMRALGNEIGAYNATVTAVVPNTSVTFSAMAGVYPVPAGAYVRFGNSIAVHCYPNAAGINLDRMFILGFNTAVATECGRLYIDSVEADCTTAMYVTRGGDASYISKVHCVPYYGGDVNKRPGPNFLFTRADGWYLESCSSVYWANGFVAANVGGMTFNRCWVETSPDSATTTTGFRTEGAFVNEVTLLQCKVSGCSLPFDFQHIGGAISAIGCATAEGAGDATNIAHYRLGLSSSGQIIAPVVIAGSLTPFVVQAGVGQWQLTAPLIYGAPTTWMSGAPADLANVAIIGGALNGALNLTAPSGQSIVANSAITANGAVNFINGAQFNNVIAPSPTDLSHHIQFFPGYGVSLSASRVNVVSGNSVAINTGGTEVALINASAATFNGAVNIGGATSITGATTLTGGISGTTLINGSSIFQVGTGVNAIRLTPAASGSNPVMSLLGDANLGLQILCAGTGGVQIVGRVGFNSTVPVAKPTGWGAATGTATRTTFVTGSVTLPALAEHVKALIDDLTAYGLIGP